VIGLNEAAHLRESIGSLLQQGFDRSEIEIIYVDSGSDDGSPEMAREAGVDRLVTISRATANAARARNAGLAEARAAYVQFVDGDTRIEPDWARLGIEALEADVSLAGVEGALRERSPEASLYDAVCELDWPSTPGEIDYVGGNGLYRAEPLHEVMGFHPDMRLGEEPELGVRLRARGFRMRHLDVPMARHDLELFSLEEYLGRACTGGKACASVVLATGGPRRGYWSERMWRTLAHAFALSAPLAVALPLSLFSLEGALALACLSPIALVLLALRKSQLRHDRASRRGLSLLYGLHSYISKIPAAVGILSVLCAGRSRRIASSERRDSM